MPKFLKDQPKWMSAVFAVLVLSCGLLGADILGQLADLRSSEPVGSLDSHADSAPPFTAERSVPYRLSGKSKETQPSPSPSPSASPKSAAETAPPPVSAEAPALPVAASDAETYAYQNTHPQPSHDAGGSQSAQFRPNAQSERREYEDAEENQEIALQGIMLGNSAGIAVVEYEGETYTVGQGESVGDYKVEDIKANRVIFKRQGQLSQAHIDTPADSLGGAAAGAQPASSSGVGDYPPVLPPPEDVPLPPQPVSLPETKRQVKTAVPQSDAVYNITEADFTGSGVDISPAANELTREELDEFTRKGAALLADIRGSEVENGRGIQVQFRNPDNALAKLGMKDGDVVLRINSKNVYGVEDIYNAVLTMRDAPQIDIEISRDGQPLSLFHKFPER